MFVTNELLLLLLLLLLLKAKKSNYEFSEISVMYSNENKLYRKK